MTIKHLGIALLIAVFASTSYARDDKGMYSIEQALDSNTAREKLDQNIRFYFGDQKHPKIVKKHGSYTSNKKTNAFGKSDKEACERAFLSALITFQQRAVKEGGNAVVNIHSYYKKNDISSRTEFECGAGAVMAGTTLTGDVVTLAK